MPVNLDHTALLLYLRETEALPSPGFARGGGPRTPLAPTPPAPHNSQQQLLFDIARKGEGTS